MTYFYEHTTKIVVFEEALDNQKHLSKKERDQLENVGKATVHIKIVEYCLDNLHEDQHKTFTKHLNKNTGSKKIHKLATKHIENYDKEVAAIAKQVEKDLIGLLNTQEKRNKGKVE